MRIKRNKKARGFTSLTTEPDLPHLGKGKNAATPKLDLSGPLFNFIEHPI